MPFRGELAKHHLNNDAHCAWQLMMGIVPMFLLEEIACIHDFRTFSDLISKNLFSNDENMYFLMPGKSS
jgi:hypothetical protein